MAETTAATEQPAEQIAVRGLAHGVGRAALFGALAVNIFGAGAAALRAPALMEWHRCAVLLLCSAAPLWLLLALLCAFSDTQTGEILRDPALKRGGRSGFAHTLWAVAILLGELFFLCQARYN